MADTSTDSPVPICVLKTEPCDISYSSENLNVSSLEPLIPYTAPNKLKDPVVVLERCDKIWKTLTLIKQLQTKSAGTREQSEKSKPQTVSKPAERLDDKPVLSKPAEKSLNKPAEKSSTKPTNKLVNKPAEKPVNKLSDMPAIKVVEKVAEKQARTVSPSVKPQQVPYMAYEPMLVKDTSTLPELKISVKARKKLYHCQTCGKQYSEARSLRVHAKSIHGIIIPLKRKGYKRVTEPRETNESTSGAEKTETKPEGKLQPRADVATEKPKLPPADKSRPRSLIITNVTTEAVASPTVQAAPQVRRSLPAQDVNKKPPRQQTSICFLCQQKVVDIRRHFIDYHKIECPDMMLQEFGKTLSADVAAKTRKADMYMAPVSEAVQVDKTEKPEKTEAMARPMKRIEKDTNENKKRKFPTVMMRPRKKPKPSMPFTSMPLNKDDSIGTESTVQPAKQYQCDICFGVYANRTCLTRHRANHIKNGETKETIHLFAFRYRNSPYRNSYCPPLEQTKPLTESSDATLSKDESEPENQVEKQIDPNKPPSNVESNNEVINTCKCGKSFRHPHTFHAHKQHCKKLTEEEPEDQRSSSDRDSGIGINITIKKKNDSYEIVGKEGSNDASKNSDHSLDLSDLNSGSLNNTLTKDKNFSQLESSKYSKEHSVLKLELAEEDEEIDILEEEPKTDLNKDASSKSPQTDDVATRPVIESVVECKPEPVDMDVEIID